MFYEQLALKGFQACLDYSKKHIADISVNGNIIAYFTKADTIEPNPYAEDVEPGTIEKIRDVLSDTIVMFEFEDIRQLFTDNELTTLYTCLVKVVMMPDDEISFQESIDISKLVKKFEIIMPELAGIGEEIENEYDDEYSEDYEEVEQ